MPKPMYGRGFKRMNDRLGADKAEQLRLQVLKDQEAALAQAKLPPKTSRDRSHYKDYPPPRLSETGVGLDNEGNLLEVCQKCGIAIRKEGGHLCEDCGRNI